MCSGKAREQNGFTYIGLLIVVAMLAAGATAALSAGSALQWREKETELIAIGLEYRRALKSYANSSPAGQPNAPRQLTELLRDPRHPGVVRHLRRIYPDPLTSETHWGLVRDPAGLIIGIHSTSTAVPFRQNRFPVGMESFEQAESHAEWVFDANNAITRHK
jgi:type II secretory pathway pseudopilin PulG